MSLPKPSKIGLVYAGGTIALVVLLALFAVSGSHFAAQALTFTVGGLLGYGLARVLTSDKSPRWARTVALLTAAVALIVACLSLVSPFANPVLAQRLVDFYNPDTNLGLLTFGFGFVFLGETFRRVAFPSLFPATPEEAQERRRQQLRGVLIVAGLSLVAFAIAALISGFLVLISHLVVWLEG